MLAVFVSSFLLPLLTNFATDAAPDTWQRVSWAAPPLAALLTVWLARHVLQERDAVPEPGPSIEPDSDPPSGVQSAPPVQINSAFGGGIVYGVQHGNQIVHHRPPPPERPPPSSHE